VKRSKPISVISKGWKRLQMTCKRGGSSFTGSLEDMSSSFEQYVMLEDDGYEEISLAYKLTDVFPIDDIKDIMFIPQWSRTMVEPQPETSLPVDTCSGTSSSDTDANVDNKDVGHLSHKPTLDEMIGAFPHSSEIPCDTTTSLDPPSIIEEDIEEICGVSFLRPGDRNRRKIYRSRILKRISTGRAVDSETDEDSSSLSSSPDDDCVRTSESHWTKQATSNNKQRRSIRFSDEVLGQSLTTIHIVPWSEHDDANWIPRPVKCRIEL
jgi:hypothetical protein